MKNAVFAAIASLLLGIPMAVHAQVVTYDDPADFDAATTGVTSYDFPSDGIEAGDDDSVTAPYTDGPLTFGSTTPSYLLTLCNDGDYGPGPVYLSTGDSGAVNSTISLNGASALALTFGTFFSADTVTVDVNGLPATILTTSAGHPTTQFFGLTDSTPITSLSFSITGSEFDVLNFQVGSAVPEPSTWMMMFGGLGTLGGVHYFRRRTPL